MADADRGTAPKAPPPVVGSDDDAPADLADQGGEADELPDLTPRPTTSGPPPVADVAASSPAAVAPPAIADAPAFPPATSTDAKSPVAEPSPSPDAAVKALLSDEHSARPSVLLWPLRVLNAPLAGLSDRGRLLIGLLGVITLVPAAAAIVWVLYFKR